MLLAFSIASSTVRKVRMLRTGPKISSRAMQWLWVTPVKIVGGMKNPLAGRRHGGCHISAPSFTPISR